MERPPRGHRGTGLKRATPFRPSYVAKCRKIRGFWHPVAGRAIVALRQQRLAQLACVENAIWHKASSPRPRCSGIQRAWEVMRHSPIEGTEVNAIRTRAKGPALCFAPKEPSFSFWSLVRLNILVSAHLTCNPTKFTGR